VQRTAAYFLSLGHHDALIRRMGAALHDRREVMTRAIADHGLQIAGQGAYGGSSLWMRAPKSVDTQELARRLQSRSVLIEPGHSFFSGPSRPRNFYRLAYSSIPSQRIPNGISVVSEEIEAMANLGLTRV
jgi:GntR family transcriptional regulator/MocR family aminotransferase